jgi:hypothetical protein
VGRCDLIAEMAIATVSLCAQVSAVPLSVFTVSLVVFAVSRERPFSTSQNTEGYLKISCSLHSAWTHKFPCNCLPEHSNCRSLKRESEAREEPEALGTRHQEDKSWHSLLKFSVRHSHWLHRAGKSILGGLILNFL